MSKRTDTIRNLFAQPSVGLLSADNKEPETRRVAAGAVRTMKETFSNIERENEALRAQFTDGEHLIDIDPSLIDPSPFADRFEHDDDVSFESLKQSIADRGQEIPVLVRPHAGVTGRYQTAFGHRRIRAARQLGRMVKAIVRALNDDELIVAQGVENSAREDLSFIERAAFALMLESSGRSRAVIQQALAIDRAEASKLISVAKAVPNEFVRAIGKAPKIGRRRWQEFADALVDAAALKRVQVVIALPDFTKLDSDVRFARALNAVNRREGATGTAMSTRVIKDPAGQVLAQVRSNERDVKVTLTKSSGTAFAQFLMGRLPDLFQEFHSSGANRCEAKDL
jgi:ParB family chromosome partitioning protein